MIDQISSNTTATVFWVSPHSEAEYTQSPERMRTFRTLDEACSFVLRELSPVYRPDARILTADRTLMYEDITGNDGGPFTKLARLHFGSGQAEMRRFNLAVSTALLAK